MSQESLQVLKMLSEGKITIDDANSLLQALDEGIKSPASSRDTTPTPQERRAERQDEFFARLTPKQLVELRMYDVTPDYVRAMRGIGYPNLSPSQLIALRMHDVKPEYVQAMRDAGYTDLSPEQLAELGMHDIDPSLVAVFQSMEHRRPSVAELIEMGMHGVTEQFVTEMHEVGFGDLDAHKSWSRCGCMASMPTSCATCRRQGWAN